MATRPHVGTLREGPLHVGLKEWLAEDGDLFEEPVGGYVIDIVRGKELIEIQTRGFASMKKKLPALLADHPVRLVHPIPTEKWIVKVGDGGELLSRRRSPKRGGVHDLFGELVSFPQLISHSNLTIEVLLTSVEEIRTHQPNRAWRRRGWVVEERRLLEVQDRVVFDAPESFAALLPEGLESPFTTADLATAIGRPRRVAQQMAYCLRNADLLTPAGKEGNAVRYERAESS